MSENKTHILKLVDPDYIGAFTLDGVGDKTFSITKVQREEVTGEGGIKDHCVVVHLKDEKPFILNATNRKSIVKLYGSHIEDWIGLVSKSRFMLPQPNRPKGLSIVCEYVKKYPKQNHPFPKH